MYKQIIIARKDLDMSPGKLAAQVGHTSMAFLTSELRDSDTVTAITKAHLAGWRQHLEPDEANEIVCYESISLFRQRLVRAVDLRRIHKMRFASKK